MTTSFPSPEDFDDDGTAVVGEGEGESFSEDDGSEVDNSADVSTETPDAEVDSGQTESTETPESKKLDLNEYGDYLVDIVVDGETLTVPVSETLNGYSRTEDYTRKRQRDAELVKAGEAFQALQQKLQENPQEVLAALSSRYGQNGTPAAPSTEGASGEAVDPKLAALEAQVGYFVQQEQDRLLNETLAGFEAIDDQFDRDAFVKSAVAAGITDVSDLEPFYKIQAYDKMMATRQANTQHQQASAADDAQRQAAAQAAGDLHSGSGVAGGSTAPTTFDSFEDAVEAAIAAAGGWD